MNPIISNIVVAIVSIVVTIVIKELYDSNKDKHKSIVNLFGQVNAFKSVPSDLEYAKLSHVIADVIHYFGKDEIIQLSKIKEACEDHYKNSKSILITNDMITEGVITLELGTLTRMLSKRKNGVGLITYTELK
jgi:hypothetical protein